MFSLTNTHGGYVYVGASVLDYLKTVSSCSYDVNLKLFKIVFFLQKILSCIMINLIDFSDYNSFKLV